MSSELAQQQSQLLAHIFGAGSPANQPPANPAWHNAGQARGLRAYRDNGHALAQRVLAGAYPVVQQMLGEHNFAAVAREHWHTHPPALGDMAQWGSALPAFLRQHPALQAEPFLPDVAQTEWLLHRCATQADAQADLASFGLLATHEPELLGLQLAPGTALVPSTWPVVSLVQAHLEAAQQPDLRQAKARMQAGVGETALVWRQGFKPCVREASASESAWLQALLAGHSLSAALDAALDAALHAAGELDPNTWLPEAVQSGLALRVLVIDAAHS